MTRDEARELGRKLGAAGFGWPERALVRSGERTLVVDNGVLVVRIISGYETWDRREDGGWDHCYWDGVEEPQTEPLPERPWVDVTDPTGATLGILVAECRRLADDETLHAVYEREGDRWGWRIYADHSLEIMGPLHDAEAAAWVACYEALMTEEEAPHG